MIFKKLFKPLTQQKWQHQDVEIRIKALDDLSADDAKHKSILHELAFNDASDKVRKLALQRLNDFSLWWQASKSDKNERVKKLAEDNIRKGLLGNADFVVDENTKSEFIDQCNKATLLEELALKDKDEKVRFKLLNKLNKNNLLLQSLQDNQTSQWLKQQIVTKIDDLAVLEKLAKKADEVIKPLLQDKISQIKDATQKPLQLKKEVGLMLAKLNALKDKMDIVDIEAKQAQLVLEWQTLQQSFDLLAQEQVTEYQAKYDKISSSLANIVAPLKQKWQQQQAKAADEAEKRTNQQALAQRLAQVEAQLSEVLAFSQASSEDTSAEALSQQCSDTLKQIQQSLSEMNLAQQDKNAFVAKIELFYGKIEKIPLISECMAQALQLIGTLSTIAVPTTTDELKATYPSYQDWQKQWKQNQRKAGIAFGQTIDSAYQALHQQWQVATTPLLKEQQQLFSQARKGLTDLRHLLSSGKYRRAFALFKKVSFLKQQLSEDQFAKLSRDFETVSAKVEEMADWQEYIATPRKQQILEEMLALANNPVADPNEQAQKVKFTRQMWNSLGSAAQESDSELNQQFNQACEKAFEVCRTFYAEKETLRAANLVVKQKICSELEASGAMLQQQPVPWQKVESAIAAARKGYKASGEVDRDQVTQINKRYYDTLNPIQKALRQYHDENAELKNQLVNNAQALLEQEDVFEAVNQIKALQQKWKTIGFAGSKNDGQTWRKFRQLNDKIFAKRDEVKNQRSEANQQQLTEFQQQLKAIEEEVKNAQQLSGLAKSQDALHSLIDRLKDQPKPVEAKIAGRANKLNELIDSTRQALKQNANKQKYVVLFQQFEQVSEHGDVDPQIESTAVWNDVFMTMPSAPDLAVRHDLTLKLEIVKEVDSPASDKQKRMALQMSLLSDKMNGAQMASTEQLLKDWLSVGRLDSQEQPLLARVKALYL